TKRGPHRSHGVRARRPNTNLEQFKQTMLHRTALVAPYCTISRLPSIVPVRGQCDPGADFCRSFPCLMRSLSIAGVVVLTLCGLCGSAPAQRYTFHAYGQSDGLKNLNTRCFLEDATGFLWVCTEDGL